jgi:hypothetical protein
MVERLARGETVRVTIAAFASAPLAANGGRPCCAWKELRSRVGAAVVRRMQMPAKATAMKARLVVA